MEGDTVHWQTHTVFNQPIPLNNSNLYLSDGALCEAVTREGAGWDSDFLASIGQQLGTAESLELGRLANVNPPELLRYDAQGRRLDDVRFHPAWHLLMQALCTNRVHPRSGRMGAVSAFPDDIADDMRRMQRVYIRRNKGRPCGCDVA